MINLLMTIPNFSEGRDLELIGQLAAGERILDCHSDPQHHRTVVTMVDCYPDRLISDLLQKVELAIKSIDLRRHQGLHPRVGAADVLPIVPLGNTPQEVADEVATRLGETIWQELGVSVAYYGRLATGRRLTEIRSALFTPDLGFAPHPSAGICCITARPPLVAYNLAFQLPITQVRQLARSMRQIPTVQALAFPLSKELSQLSMNLQNPFKFGTAQAYAQATAWAGVEAVPELVGLCPAAASGPGCERGLLEDRMTELAVRIDERELKDELLQAARQGIS